MSGIGGIVGYGAGTLAAANVCEGMLGALKMRGADGHGTFISQEVCLIHTSYINAGCPSNVENCKQPYRSFLGNKEYVLVYDGELYNKDELRKELVDMGYRFLDQCDAAVILHGYMAWGEGCVEKMNGVFAFALWDGARLFIARDRLGQRTLFYSAGSYGLVFASTIKAVLTHPRIQPVIGEEGVAELLLLGPARSPANAIFKGIRELSPGQFGTYAPGQRGVKLSNYWRLKAKPFFDNFNEATEKVRTLLFDAVKRQCAGKEKKGTLLSGGLDSGAIASCLQKAGYRQSFSLDYIPADSQPESDADFIKRMTDFFGLRHKNIVLGNDELADALKDAMLARGFPGMADVDSAFLLFLKKVKENVPVAFSGEGADEIFGGYPWFHDEAMLNDESFPWSLSAKERAKFLLPHLVKNPEEYVRHRYKNTIAAASTLSDDEPQEKRMRQMHILNLGWFLQTLSARNDSMAAAAGISVRTPFLDYRLVEYLYNVPWSFKNHGEREKGLLREALKGVLPEKVLLRKKYPFPKTHSPAYLALVKGMLKNVCESSNSPIFKLCTKTSLLNLLAEESQKNWYGQLMSYPQTIAYFLQLNAWLGEFSVRVEK
ncbi:MAG: asparagine synthase (glutamine-hydrolyzing) [Defluviitaleaceae bacterium]|nr:asparagine synthase (glutamine-hydrolyzing) [Defluviitaleaceae bacterium]